MANMVQYLQSTKLYNFFAAWFKKPVAPEPKTYILFDRIANIYYPIYKDHFISYFRESDGATKLQKYIDGALKCSSEESAKKALDDFHAEISEPRLIVIEYTPKIAQ